MYKRYRMVALDDDPVGRSWLEEFISFNGYAVEAVPLDRVEPALAARPDIVVVVEPEGDEEAVQRACATIRMNRWARNVPVLLVTNRSEEAAALWARRLGVDGVIVRPFKVHDLLRHVRRLTLAGRVRRAG